MSHSFHPLRHEPGAPGAWERDWSRFDEIDIRAAAEALEGVVQRTPLRPLEVPDTRIELRLKLENRQLTGAFKARGAWNQVRQLGPAERAAGVVATSSGNHGKALAWAAQRAGVPATIVMPADAYPNKIAACREHGAEVVLAPTRAEAEERCAALVRAGATLVHPYDAQRTVAGAGTVGLEIAQQWPEVEVVLIPAGGGGLAAGCSLALRRELGEGVRILAVEPAGAPTLTRGLAAHEPVTLETITTAVQGLCPPNAGALNIAICGRTLTGTIELDDESILAAQARLVHAGEVVEPAGAASFAAVLCGALPAEWLAPRGAQDRLRVCAILSGGNPAPDQLEALRRERWSER